MLLVDSRAGSSELLKPLSTRLNGGAKLSILDSGDVCWYGSGPIGECLVGAEVKSITDLLDSARSGRYQAQLGRMTSEYDFVYLIYYGIFKPGEDGILLMPTKSKVGKRYEWVPLAPISRAEKAAGRKRRIIYPSSELYRFIASLELKKNVNVIRCTSKLDVVWALAGIYQWWQKDWDSHQSTEAVKSQTDSIYRKPSTTRAVASSLPGVGWELAGKVERTFGSVIAMANASIEEWAGVSWVTKTGRKMTFGRKKAEGVWKAIREGGGAK